ncbi:cadherin-86C-like [Pollicipes pollicipes]|uniref:cadherin-86C-like n=1 Tax=Pollicipes pollicipes TaxID=41117 RepID=UPI001884C856|nr:cadherin-86C-like [Pollicipes pollicipes]
MLDELNFSVVAEEVTAVGGQSSRAHVTLYVRDANDNVPEFAETRYVASVPENVRRGTLVAWMQALDPDSGAFGTDGVRFTGLTGDIAQHLRLDPVTGKITMATDDHGLDRETTPRHQLTVEARDDDGRGNRNRVPLELVVTDVNDRAPRCLRPLYQLTVPENSRRLPPAHLLEAADDDQPGTPNAEVGFRILAGDPQRNFSIDGSTGELHLQRPLDFEAMYGDGDIRTINLTIQVFDKGEPPLSSTCLVQVLVQDVNDVAPRFERTVYVKAVSEDAPGGTHVIQVSARDGDGSYQNSRVVYRIQHGAQDKFVINSTTGVITVAQGANLDPDFSRPRAAHFELTVAALDGGIGANQLVDVATVNITIQDVNNKLPAFVEPGLVAIPENLRVGSVVRRVAAVDMDAIPLLRYSIDHSLGEARNEEGTLVRASDYNFTAAFQIHPIEGVIRTARTLDRERVETIRLVLRVEDLAAMNSRQTATGP